MTKKTPLQWSTWLATVLSLLNLVHLPPGIYRDTTPKMITTLKLLIANDCSCGGHQLANLSVTKCHSTKYRFVGQWHSQNDIAGDICNLIVFFHVWHTWKCSLGWLCCSCVWFWKKIQTFIYNTAYFFQTCDTVIHYNNTNL